MSVGSGSNYVVYEGVVKSVERSLIPQVFIITVRSHDAEITFDIHKMLKNFEVNDKVRITLSKGRPVFREGVDLVMRGYVMSKGVEGGVYQLLISLWGFLLIVESNSDTAYNLFDYMDEVYFKLEVI